MSAFIVKLIALASMLVDHTAYFLMHRNLVSGDFYVMLRSIGRIAFPVYCFMIVNGFGKTSDPKRYLSRLILFAAISQIPFSMVFSPANYDVYPSLGFQFSFAFSPVLVLALILGVCAVWFLFVRRDGSVLLPAIAVVLAAGRWQVNGVMLLVGKINVFYTLALGLSAMCVLSRLKDGEGRWYEKLLCAAGVVAPVIAFGTDIDYSYGGLALLLLLYLCRGSRPAQAAAILLWCWYTYLYSMFTVQYAVFAALSLVPVFLYNGDLGRPMKKGFYLAYPVHFAILAVINLAVPLA